MPNKTIYVKDADLPLFEQAQESFGESISSLFAEFLRDRVSTANPEESRIETLIEEIRKQIKATRKDRTLPGFITAEYDEAEECAEKALKSLRRGDIRQTKVWFYAANVYREKAERDVKEARDLAAKLASMLAS